MTENKWSPNFISLRRKIDTKQAPSEGTNAIHRNEACSWKSLLNIVSVDDDLGKCKTQT
jgi:hypothetical protein